MGRGALGDVGVLMREQDFLEAVLELAEWCQWRVTHSRPARTSDGWATAISGAPGFPDLVLVRPPRVVFVELKTERGQPTKDQTLWLAALAASNVETYLWRPSDLDAIADLLAPAAKDRPRRGELVAGAIGQAEFPT